MDFLIPYIVLFHYILHNLYFFLIFIYLISILNGDPLYYCFSYILLWTNMLAITLIINYLSFIFNHYY